MTRTAVQTPQRVAAALLATLAVASAAVASDGAGPAPSDTMSADTAADALTGGRLDVDFRLRTELVDQDPFTEDALATTLRTELSYETLSFRGFFAGMTLESVTPIGSDTTYDNGGAGRRANGVRDRPVIADPEITELDRLYVGYGGHHGFDLKIGRMGLVFDDQRFVGLAGWRQNRRSFEAAQVGIGSDSTLRAKYAFLNRVHYNSGASPKLEGHLMHLARDLGFVRAAAYAYLLDWDDVDRHRLSSATYGLRVTGEADLQPYDLRYFGEYAQQHDTADNPESFELDYAHAGLTLARAGWSLQVAWELKDGNGVSAVQTPIGSNFGMNGFADQLVVTPPEGSHDLYLRLRRQTNRWSWLVGYHDLPGSPRRAPAGFRDRRCRRALAACGGHPGPPARPLHGRHAPHRHDEGHGVGSLALRPPALKPRRASAHARSDTTAAR